MARLGQYLIFLVFPLVVALVFVVAPPGTRHFSDVALHGPFHADSGHAYVATGLDDLQSDGPENPRGSTLELAEDATKLGPGHSSHATVRASGKGRFSHWQGKLWFSTSDNSDPNSNGRRYAVRVPWVWSTAVYLGMLAVALPFVAFLVFRLVRPCSAWLRAAAILLLAAAALEVGAWTLTRQRLAVAPLSTRHWFAHLFEGEASKAQSASALYEPHPFLNYALNPSAKLGTRKQTNDRYLIRRLEKLRPRAAVRWRALVLGGSTTFGEFLENPADVWVRRLEVALRAAHGDDVDCINGGVSGYTLLENLVHYALLLDDLDPDVVILYVGINDVPARLVGRLRPDYRNYRVPWASREHGFPEPNALLAWSWAYRFPYLVRNIEGHSVVHILQLVSKPLPGSGSWANKLTENDAHVFERKLGLMLDLLHARGRKVVVLPQYFHVRSKSDEVFLGAVRQHNAICRKAAEQRGLPYLAALDTEGVFEPGECFDNCHFNAAGSAKMARLVFAFLQANQLDR